jgi:hypothetical protein
MADINSNYINYFKSQTITDTNTRNETNLHDAVVENINGVIYLIEKEGVNLEGDTTFDKNYGHSAVKNKKQPKFLTQDFAESRMQVSEIDHQRVIQNTYIP